MPNVAKEAHGGFESLLASLLRPLSRTATHPPNYRSLHRLWAQLLLVVTRPYHTYTVSMCFYRC